MVSKIISIIFGLLFLFFAVLFLDKGHTFGFVFNFTLLSFSVFAIISKKERRKPLTPIALSINTIGTALLIPALIILRNNSSSEFLKFLLLENILLFSFGAIGELVRFFFKSKQNITSVSTPIFRSKKYRGRRIALVLAGVILLALVAWLIGSLLFSGDEGPAPTQPGASAGQSAEDAPADQPTTTTTKTTRATLPKAFIDKNTYSPYAVLYDVDNDDILYSKAAEKKCYPASLTKLMTALVALDYTKPEDTFTLGTELYMISPGSSSAYLTVGTKLTMEQLLQALLLPSGNDAAYAVAVQVGRIIENNPDLDRYAAVSAFLKKMNAKAKELGCKKTNFENPDGYHDKDHYTTAKDMMYIAREAIKNDTIKTIVSTPQVTVRFLSGQSATWHNSNKLLQPNNSYTYEGAFGLKTGTTDEAGKCLAACATRNGRTSLVIVMGAKEESGRWEDARGLLDLSFQ